MSSADPRSRKNTRPRTPEGAPKCPSPPSPPSPLGTAPFCAPWPPAAAAAPDRARLTVDGMALADQFAGLRLLDAGLITAAAGPVALTASAKPC